MTLRMWFGVFGFVVLFVSWALSEILLDPLVRPTTEYAIEDEAQLTKQVIAATIAKIKKKEGEITDEILDGTKDLKGKVLQRGAKDFVKDQAKPDKLYKRDAHPYSHGCVRATFEVKHDVPDKYKDSADTLHNFRQGVFSKPGAIYKAWVRFSNGTQPDDRTPDGRGMAIKLMGADGLPLKSGHRQDFVMLNYHTFLVRDLAEYQEFFSHQINGTEFSYFINFGFDWHLREMWKAVLMVSQDVPSPVTTQYHSMLPYRIGLKHSDKPASAIKFSAMPCDPSYPHKCTLPDVPMPDDRGPHYLREQLVKDLQPLADSAEGDQYREPGAMFAFGLQPQVAGKNMPIEDATITWLNTDSRFVAVALVKIPRQVFDTDEQNHFCENLSFTPWQHMPQHEPIGSLNRARKKVYDAISDYRHEGNDTAVPKPTGWCLPGGTPCDPVNGAAP